MSSPHDRSESRDALRVPAPRLTMNADGSSTVSATIEFHGRPAELWYRFRGAVPEASASAFVPAVLLPAMLQRRPLVFESPVSPRLLEALPTIQDIYATWVPALQRVPVRAASGDAHASTSGEPGPDSASFFTGGLDSLYTYLTHRDRIGSLVFVPDFSAAMSADRRENATKWLREAAAEFGVRLIEVETNHERLLEDWLEIGLRGQPSPTLMKFELAHGAALAAVAHLLPRSIGRVFVAASFTYNHLAPLGSHPLLDPLWSTEARSIVHDGCAATRVDKARVVATSEIALRTLQVCASGGTGEFRNCGRCDKCLRTMVNLRVVGALERCPVFAEPLDLRRVSLTNMANERIDLADNLLAAKAIGTDRALIAALERGANPWAPGRLLLQLMLAGWRLTKRVVPVRRVNGRIRWGTRPA
jgi:hypothetical protein